MELQAEEQNGVLVVTVLGDRIDAAGAIQFKDTMREVTATPHNRVVMDLSNVAFLDSSGLGAVVATMKAIGKERKLELAALTPAVSKVFRLTRMDSVFTVHDAVADALSVDASAA